MNFLGTSKAELVISRPTCGGKKMVLSVSRPIWGGMDGPTGLIYGDKGLANGDLKAILTIGGINATFSMGWHAFRK